MTFQPTPPPEREFPKTRLQQRKEQLLSQIQAEDRQSLQQPRRRRWALAVGGITAVAAVAIAVLVLLPAGGGGPTPAAAALNRLARLVAAQSLTPQPGQYLYIDFTSEYGAFEGNCETRAVEHRQIWIGADGSGLDRSSDARAISPRQLTAPPACRSPSKTGRNSSCSNNSPREPATTGMRQIALSSTP